MTKIEHLLLLLLFISFIHANTPPKTTYNENNQPLVIEYEDGNTILYEYDAVGRTTSTTDQNGNTTTYTYDAVGNRLSQTDALNNQTTFTYDAQGNMLCMTDALGQTTTYTYNVLNQRIKTTYADGSSVTESKNISGLPSSKTNEAGQTTSYGYDTSRVIPLLNQVTLPNSATTKYEYDSQGKKTAQTDALGHTTSYTYKSTGELETETLPQGEQKTFTYDTTGKQTQVTDYANKTQKFIYDAYDKLVRIEYVDGSTVTYAYTPSGRVQSITDSQGTIANTYDSMGRLKTQTTSTSSVTATISYSYDSVGNITKIETPTQTITKTYDKLNRLETVTDAQGTVTYTYDALGRQTQVSFANGVTTNYEYDSRNRITKIEHKKSDGAVLQSFAYTLDAVGNRTQIVELSGRTVSYEYNAVNQLTKETVSNDPKGNNTTTTFTYDDVGNMLTKTIDTSTSSVTEDYSYNANDQLTTQGSKTFTYDANGNLISDTDNTYEYDDKNRLIKVTTPTDTVEYSYDANDNRVAKTTNNGTTTYLIDANTAYAQVITESKDDGTEIKYTYGNDLLSDGSHNFLTDALGSTRGLVDSAETLTDSYDYTPYGEIANHEGTSENSFLFTGEQLDSETDNYFLRARYYSPNSSRFMSRDTYDGTVGNPITQNHYLYAGSNPSMYVDPSGHFFTMSGLTSSIATMSTLSNVYTIASIGVDIAGGNYAGASKAIMEEVVSSKLGRIRAVGNLGRRGISMFAKIFRRGKPPVLDLASAHSSTILAKNMKELGFNGNASAAHHIIGSGAKSKLANDILKNARININSPSNGVFLPNTKTWRTSPASPHMGRHNDEYWNLVNSTLMRAVRGKTPGTDAYKWATIDAISEIRLKLLTGQVSLNKNLPYN